MPMASSQLLVGKHLSGERDKGEKGLSLRWPAPLPPRLSLAAAARVSLKSRLGTILAPTTRSSSVTALSGSVTVAGGQSWEPLCFQYAWFEPSTAVSVTVGSGQRARPAQGEMMRPGNNQFSV
jgi:hypothetical protein